MTKKDKLLDFLNAVNAEDLWNELYRTDDVDSFIRNNQKVLRQYPNYAEYESDDRSPEDKVRGAFTDFDVTHHNANYLEGMANKLGIPTDVLKSTLTDIYTKDKAAADYMRDKEIKYKRQQAVNDYQHSYLGMDLENPFNRFLNAFADIIISPYTKQAIIDDPDNTARLVANATTDIGSTFADFLPGVGGVVAGPGIRTVRAIAEGDEIGDALLRGGSEVLGNQLLSKGIHGVPGFGDIGWLHTLKNKAMPKVSEWGKKAAKADEHLKAPLPDVPTDVKTYVQAQDWIMHQPEWARGAYENALDDSFRNVKNADLPGARKTLEQQRLKENRVIDRARDWTKAYKYKASVGRDADQAIVGTERTALQKNLTSKAGERKDKTITSTKKATNYNKTLEWIIENNKKFWESGFKPNAGIELDAWEKWNAER